MRARRPAVVLLLLGCAGCGGSLHSGWEGVKTPGDSGWSIVCPHARATGEPCSIPVSNIWCNMKSTGWGERWSRGVSCSG